MENARLVQTIPVVPKTPIAAEYASIVQVGLTQTGKAIIASINADQRVWYMVIVAVDSVALRRLTPIHHHARRNAPKTGKSATSGKSENPGL